MAQNALLDIGCMVYPIGLLTHENEIRGLKSILINHRVDTIITVPSFLETMLAYGFSKKDLYLKRIITSGEYLYDGLRNKIKRILGIPTYSSYASSEAFVGIECNHHCGFHFDPKKVHVDIVPQQNIMEGGFIAVSVSVSRENILSPINMLGDIGIIDNSPCLCGSKYPRVLLHGRMSDQFVVAGAINVYPYQIYEAFSRSGIRIDKCKIFISSGNKGVDTVKFVIYTSKLSLPQIQHTKKVLATALCNLSIDFKDGVHSGNVRIFIRLISKKQRFIPNTKNKKLFIYDRRQFVR